MEAPKWTPSAEQTTEGESKYFNSKFPKAGTWLGVLVREAVPDSGKKGNARRFEVVVTYHNDAPNAPSPEGELFVCYYDEGDPAGRERTEDLLSKIYPGLSKTQ